MQLGLQAVIGFVLLNQRFLKEIDRFPPLLFGQVVGTDNLSWMPPAVVDSVPPEARLSLVGDGKAFLYQRPMSLLHYRTIFDVDTSRTSRRHRCVGRAGTVNPVAVDLCRSERAQAI